MERFHWRSYDGGWRYWKIPTNKLERISSTKALADLERDLILMANFYREHGFEAEAWQIAEEMRELKSRHDQS